MLIGSWRKLNGIENFDVVVNGYVLKRVKVMKCLGVLIDEELHWTQQVDKVAKTVQSKLGILRRVKPYIPKECLNLLLHIACSTSSGLLLPNSVRQIPNAHR